MYRKKTSAKMQKLSAKEDKTLADLIELYQMVMDVSPREGSAFKDAATFFGRTRMIKEISPLDVRAFHTHLRKRGNHYNTVVRTHTCLKKIFRWGLDSGLIKLSPVHMIPRPNHREFPQSKLEPQQRRAITPEEFKQLVDFYRDNKDWREKQYIRHAIAVGYYTGMRYRDVADLERDSFQEGKIIVHTQKTFRRISIPIDHPVLGGGALMKELEDLTFAPDQRYAFPILHKRSKCIDWIDYFTRAGIQNANGFYSLRHAFVTRLKASGLTFKEIATFTGHTSEASTWNYSHTEASNNSQIADTLRDERT
jgi:integrase